MKAMKKIYFYCVMLCMFFCWGCEKPNELPPREEAFNDMDFTLPALPRLTDAERDIIAAQKQVYEEAIGVRAVSSSNQYMRLLCRI